MSLWERRAPASPEEAVGAVHDFVSRCRDYAMEEIARRGVSGKDAREWESYLRFTEHTLRELEDGTLDHWFRRTS